MTTDFRNNISALIIASILPLAIVAQAGTTAKATSQVEARAITKALDWSLANLDGVSVAVFLGTESKVTPEQIETVLTQDFASHGITKVAFFFEQNDIPNTVLLFSTNGSGDGPFYLGDSRKEVPRVASQLKFEISNGLVVPK